LILLGKDWSCKEQVEKARDWAVPTGTRIPPPPEREDNGTSYAVHDFLERFCGVRWYGPGDLEMVVPNSKTLAVQPRDLRRAPAIKFRTCYYDLRNMLAGVWGNPTSEQLLLFRARLKVGGEKYESSGFEGYYDRFWKKNPEHPERFVATHPDWFGHDYPPETLKRFNGQPPQLCFSNPEVIQLMVEEARAFFDGRGPAPGNNSDGDYFSMVPMDNRDWCRCPLCRPQFDPKKETHPERNEGHFSNGYASDYWFTFVNKVAREVAKTHPHKYIATIAYADFAYHPEKVKLEPNISVQMCLHARNCWCPYLQENDQQLYRDWLRLEPGRRLNLWLYYCFPEELAAGGGWHCFPGFFAHTLDREIKTFARDGIRGAFLNGIAEQVDTYLTFKLFDDPTLDVDAMLDEFFTRYYGPAAEPMKRIYLRIEEIYSSTANYPDRIRKKASEDHQDEEMAWKYLGTEQRMAELGKLMDEATRLAGDGVEKQRVAMFRKEIWDYMVEGRRMYLAKQQKQR
jgi:hypothetical protein